MGQWGSVVSGSQSTSGERCENCCAVTYQVGGKGSWMGCGREEGRREKLGGKREKIPELTRTTKL